MRGRIQPLVEEGRLHRGMPGLYLTYLRPRAKSVTEGERTERSMSKGNPSEQSDKGHKWVKGRRVSRQDGRKRGPMRDVGEGGGVSRRKERERERVAGEGGGGGGGLRSGAVSRSESGRGMCGTVSVYTGLSVHVRTVSSVCIWRNSLFLFQLAARSASSHNTLPEYPDGSVNAINLETLGSYVEGGSCSPLQTVASIMFLPACMRLLLYLVMSYISQNDFQQSPGEHV